MKNSDITHSGSIFTDSAVRRTFDNRTKQVSVNDDVVFRPSLNPYLALQQANQRLAAGQSIFLRVPTSEKSNVS